LPRQRFGDADERLLTLRRARRQPHDAHDLR
jgi:hypothetical protein